MGKSESKPKKLSIDPASVKCDTLADIEAILKVFNTNTADIPRLKISDDVERVMLGRSLLKAQQIYCLSKTPLSTVDNGENGENCQFRDLNGRFSESDSSGFWAWLKANFHGTPQYCYNLMNLALNVGCGLDMPVGYAGGRYVESCLKKYSLSDLYKTPQRFAEIVEARERAERKEYNPTNTVNQRLLCMEADFELLLRAAVDATDESCDRVQEFLEKAAARFSTLKSWRADQ